MTKKELSEMRREGIDRARYGIDEDALLACVEWLDGLTDGMSRMKKSDLHYELWNLRSELDSVVYSYSDLN